MLFIGLWLRHINVTIIILDIGVGVRVRVGVLLAADCQSTSKSGYRASLWDPWPEFVFCSSFVGQLRRRAFNASSLTRKRVCNLLLNCFWALPEQSTLAEVPQNSRPYFTVSFETEPGGLGSRSYILQEQGGPVIPPGTGFPYPSPCLLFKTQFNSIDRSVRTSQETHYVSATSPTG
jgi:hypothetical protein